MVGVAEGKAGTAKWMRGRSAQLRGALLGLLLERPSHGGELANRLTVRLGETWRIDSNDVYRLLQSLLDEGLIKFAKSPGATNARVRASSTTRPSRPRGA